MVAIVRSCCSPRLIPITATGSRIWTKCRGHTWFAWPAAEYSFRPIGVGDAKRALAHVAPMIGLAATIRHGPSNGDPSGGNWRRHRLEGAELATAVSALLMPRASRARQRLISLRGSLAPGARGSRLPLRGQTSRHRHRCRIGLPPAFSSLARHRCIGPAFRQSTRTGIPTARDPGPEPERRSGRPSNGRRRDGRPLAQT